MGCPISEWDSLERHLKATAELAREFASAWGVDLLWQALGSMFEHDRSAARGTMTTRGLFIFEHDSKLGDAPAHTLFDKMKIRRKEPIKPARSFADYEVTTESDMPKGVKLNRIV